MKQEKRVRMLWRILLAHAFISPLLFTFATSELFEFPKTIALYLTAGVCLLILATAGTPRRRLPASFLFWVLPLLLSATLTSLCALHIPTTLLGYYSRFFGGLLSILSLTIMAVSFLDLPATRIRTYLAWLHAPGALAALYGIIQKFGLDSTWWIQPAHERVFSSLGQPNWLAAYLVILLALSLGELRVSQSAQHRIRWASLSVLYALVIFLTISASGIVALIVVAGAHAVILWKEKPRSSHPRSPILLTCVATLGISALLYTYTPKIHERISETGGIRFLLWKDSIAYWHTLPIREKVMGQGLAHVSYLFPHLRSEKLNATTEWNFHFNKTHNEFIDLLLQQGALGLVFWVGSGLLWIIITIRQIPHIHNSEIRALTQALLLAWGSIWLTSSLGFLVSITGIFFFLIPVWVDTLTTKTSKAIQPDRSFIFQVSAACAGIAMIVIAFRLTGAEVLATHARAMVEGSPEALAALTRAVRLNPWEAEYQAERAQWFIHRAKSEGIQKKKIAFAQSAAEFLEQTRTTNPYHSLTLRQVATGYSELGSIDPQWYNQGIRIIEDLVAITPSDPLLSYHKGVLLQRGGKFAEARAAYAHAQMLKPDYPGIEAAIESLNER